MEEKEERYSKYFSPINSHTHIGDAFIKLPKRRYSIEELVAPPNGYKHGMLEKASREEIIEGMKKAIEIMEKVNTKAFVDFREGGIEGIKMLHEALKDKKLKAIILGRPKEMKYDENEIKRILSISHGIGLSSIYDWDKSIEKIAEDVHSSNKIFAIHVSEARRENIDEVIKLKPYFIVHMCKASPKDIEKIAEENIPVVVCPRANAFFGLKPKVELMLKHGIKLMLGTDNAMIVKPDILKEMDFLIKNFGVKQEDAIKMVTSNPENVFKEFLYGKA